MAATHVTIVSPCYNEFETVKKFVDEIDRLAVGLENSGVRLRLLLINDGSKDATLAELRRLAASSLTTPVPLAFLSFPRNFGHQAALIAGFHHIDNWSDAVITMDCDLEHPPRLISEMIIRWREEGALLVSGIRRDSKVLPFKKRILSRLFYGIANILTGLKMRAGQSDFRLWDANLIRNVTPHLARMGTLRMLSSWLRVPHAEIFFDQYVREGRVTRFSFKQNIDMAIAGIVRFSNIPFHLLGICALGGLGFSFAYAAYVLISVARGSVVSGWTSLIMTAMFFGCLQMVSMWLIALYLKQLVFDRDIPLYLISEKGGWLQHEK